MAELAAAEPEILPTAPDTTTESDDPTDTPPSDVAVYKLFKDQRVPQAQTNRQQYHGEWKRNIELRMGRPITVFTQTAVPDVGEIRTEINPDWSLTKTKISNLYSQTPHVYGTHENSQYTQAVPPFVKALNYEIGEKRANVGVAMEEVLNDVVNASGIGAIFVSYSARFETIQVQQQDPLAMTLQRLGINPGPPTMVEQQRVVSDMISTTRFSPSKLLWDRRFLGSDFNQSDWIGGEFECSWAVGKVDFQLTDEQKEKVLAGSKVKQDEDLQTSPVDTGQGGGDQRVITFQRIYYWRYRVDPTEKCFTCIWQLILIDGLTYEDLSAEQKKLLHGPWKGQQKDEQSNTYVGPCKFPIQVLTLTYITDNPVPPSDSSAGRPQVNDLRRSRQQMFANRDRSIPLRWFDVNRVDPLIQINLMRGVHQGMIPMQGDGNRAIGEVARASYPAEDFAFDKATKEDLRESWRIGPNQLGTTSSGEKTAAEAKITQANFASGSGPERARVAKFFLNVVEVVAGLVALYGRFPTLTPQEKQQMEQAWNRKQILHDLVLKILPDSTVLLDTQAMIDRDMQLLNMTAKSGYVNVQPLIAEIIELCGKDPSQLLKPPPQPEPKPPDMSYSFSGKDDLNNPVVMALLVENKLAPSPQSVEVAKKILMAAAMPAPPPMPQQMLPPGPQGQAGPPQPPGEVPAPPEAHPNWEMASKIADRSRDM